MTSTACNSLGIRCECLGHLYIAYGNWKEKMKNRRFYVDAETSFAVEGRCFKESRGELSVCLGDRGLGGGVLLEI